MLDSIIRLAPLIGPTIAAIIGIISWRVAHRSNMIRDRANKRHDMIIQYLLEAYRRIETAANRENKTEEQNINFESAVADIQLFGTSEQIAEVIKYMKSHVSSGNVDIVDVLCLLRNDLRKNLELSPVDHPPVIFRFLRKSNTSLQAAGHEIRFTKQPVSDRSTPQATGNQTQRD